MMDGKAGFGRLLEGTMMERTCMSTPVVACIYWGLGRQILQGQQCTTPRIEPSANIHYRPVVEINMMGYEDPNQLGSGLRQRLYARAFIIGDVEHPTERFVYLVLDTQ